MKISLELVPKKNEDLEKEIVLVRDKYKQISTINFPDLPRFEKRSWEACEVSNKYFDSNIPHIRAIDFINKDFEYFAEKVRKWNLKEILVLSGDENVRNDDITKSPSVEFIKKIKKEINGIKVYAVIDQYRTGMRNEIEYLKVKKEAGAEGFFTQPFFCINHIEYLHNLLPDENLFWGVSPVTSEKSKLYWESKNNTVFPKEFESNIEWNIEFARKIKDFTNKINGNFYIMPIRTDLDKYLSGIFL